MKAVSIHKDSSDQTHLETALREHGEIRLCRSFTTFDHATLARVLRAWDPEMIFLDLRHPAAPITAEYLAKEFPGIRRLAIHPAQLPEVFRTVLHLGMHELVSPPFNQRTFADAIARVAAHIEANPSSSPRACRTVSFMPAKAGVGASTLAAHAAWASAEDPEARVLLADFDFHSGTTGFLFDVQNEYGIRTALAHGARLDEDLWKSVIRSVSNVDLLVSRPGNVQDPVEDHNVPAVLQFAQRNYTVVYNDLPDSLDPATLAVLHESDQIFLVSTLDLASLRIAKLKADALNRLDLQGRAELLINRWNPQAGFTLDELSRTVGMKVFATFPCVYKGVASAVREAKPALELVPAMREFAEKALGWKQKAQPRLRDRFLPRLASFGDLGSIRSRLLSTANSHG